MDQWHRQLVSRVAAGLLSGALLFGGWRCLAKGWQIDRERDARPVRYQGDRRGPGGGLVYAAGAVLVFGGILIGSIAVLPRGLIERLHAPGEPPTTGDRDGGGRRIGR